MPKVMTLKSKKTPKGFEELADQLQTFQNDMQNTELESHGGKRKAEANWRILKINHQRSRFIYNLFYIKKEINRELYDYLLKEKYADAGLIAKWKKNGYEKLCCVLCGTNTSNFGNVCVCRVPKARLDDNKLVQCNTCGCRGCASCD